MRIAAAVHLLLFLQQASPTTNRYRAINEIVRSERERQKIPAVSAAVMINGTIEYSNAFGSADVELNVAATTDTLFRTASVAKPMTAVATMQLAANGKLDLKQSGTKVLSGISTKTVADYRAVDVPRIAQPAVAPDVWISS